LIEFIYQIIFNVALLENFKINLQNTPKLQSDNAELRVLKAVTLLSFPDSSHTLLRAALRRGRMTN
jgi:hypothetical protein